MVQVQIRASFDAKVLICHLHKQNPQVSPQNATRAAPELACCLGIIRSLCLSHHVSLYGIQSSTFNYYLTVF